MRYNAEDVFSSSPLSALAPSPRKPRDTRDWPARLEEEDEEELPESSGAGARRAAERLAAALAAGKDSTEEDPSGDLVEEEEDAKEYEVERILAHKEQRGEKWYKIRWKGYSPSDDTWEPVENITATSLIEEYERQAGRAREAGDNRRKGKKRGASTAPGSRPRKVKQEKASPSTSAASLPSVPEPDSGAWRRKRGRSDEVSRAEGVGERAGMPLKRGRGSGSGASLLSPSAFSSQSTLSTSSGAPITQPSGSTPRARPRPRDSEDRLAEAQLLYLPGAGKLSKGKQASTPAALEDAGRAAEWIVPMSTVLAERAYAEVCHLLQQLRGGRTSGPKTPRASKETGQVEASGPYADGLAIPSSAVGHGIIAIVLHPANLVKLRTNTPYAGVNSIQKAASKQTAQLVQEGLVPMLTSAAFPENSRFRLTSLHNILSSNEAYKLMWNYGLLNWEDEYFHLLAAVCHLQQKPETRGRKYRVLVRKIKPHMAIPAKRLRVELVDMAGLLREVRAKLKERQS